MQVETLNKAIMLLAGSFPGITFNVRLYEEMLGEIPDKYFLEAVYDFIKTTKEIYPGTNPIAILREKALARIPALPRPKRTNEELKLIADMQKTYDHQKQKAEELVKSVSDKKDANKGGKKILGRSAAECLKILKEKGEI